MKLTTISVFLLACLSLKAAVNTQYLQGLTSPVQANIDSRVLKAGDTMSGPLAMGANKITGLGTPTLSADAATKAYVDAGDALYLLLTGGTLSGNLAFSGATTPGLVPNNLTAVEIGNLVVPPIGSTVFNETSLQLNMWDGAVWNEIRTGNYLPIAGGTLGGNLLWNTTTVPGLRLNNLTTVQRDATTPAAGSLIWNTTTTRANLYDGSAWNSGWVRLSGDTMTGALVNNAGVSLTASAPNRIVQTWNNGVVAFNGLEITITSDANGSSTFLDCYDDTVRRFWVSNGGTVNGTQYIAGGDAVLLRDAANTFGQRNGATAQTYNLYGTYTSGAEYRRLRSTMTTGGAVTIAAEGAGGGATGNTLAVAVDGTTRLSIAATGVPTFTTDQLRISTFKTPASAADTGTAGTICYDANFIYICTAANTWKRVAIATW